MAWQVANGPSTARQTVPYLKTGAASSCYLLQTLFGMPLRGTWDFASYNGMFQALEEFATLVEEKKVKAGAFSSRNNSELAVLFQETVPASAEVTCGHPILLSTP